MNVEDIEQVLSDINDFLRPQLWMDFEVQQYLNGQLIVEGSLSPLTPPEISIVFDDVFFVSMPFGWKTDTKLDILVLLEGEEARQINMRFQVEHGYHIFKFNPEYYPENFGCLVGAKSIRFQTR